MKYTENAINILTTKSYKGIGNAWIVKNLKGNEDVGTIVALISSKIQTSIEEFEDKKERYKRNLQELEDSCDGVVALGDNNFPQYRGNVKDSEQPVFLFYKGNIDLLNIDNKNITVIGLLNPEGDIEERERKLVAEFVRSGATIVSGLAFGCDEISHKQALDSGGKTVAVLPSPLHNILPTRNTLLAATIVEYGGLLVTEYGTDFKSPMELSSRYKERDRLQALFCDTIVLAASYAQDTNMRWEHLYGKKLDSGARLAMGFAKDYGIPRVVMYDEDLDNDNPMFDLNRQLVEQQREITVVNQSNLSDTVEKILSRKISRKSFQTNMFD